jgi:thioredoxin 1
VRALIEKNPAYKAVTWMRVDWDTYRNSDLVREFRIPRRSTLVMFNKGIEVRRVVAQTSESAIEALFKAVL